MKNTIFRFLSLISILTIVACTPIAGAKSSTPSDKRLEVLESRVIFLEQKNSALDEKLKAESQALRKKLKIKTKALQKSQIFFISDMDRLKKDIEILTAENEKLAKELSDNTRRYRKLQKVTGELMITIDQMNTYFEAKLDVSQDDKGASKGGNIKKGSPKKVYNDIIKQFKNNHISIALTQFNKFRTDYPNSDLSDDALFYIGYIHLLTKKYDLAMVSFFELEKVYPTSERIPEVKWWLAIALEKSGDIGAAIDTYKSLAKRTDAPRFSEKAKRRLEELTDTGMGNAF